MSRGQESLNIFLFYVNRDFGTTGIKLDRDYVCFRVVLKNNDLPVSILILNDKDGIHTSRRPIISKDHPFFYEIVGGECWTWGTDGLFDTHTYFHQKVRGVYRQNYFYMRWDNRAGVKEVSNGDTNVTYRLQTSWWFTEMWLKVILEGEVRKGGASAHYDLLTDGLVRRERLASWLSLYKVVREH